MSFESATGNSENLEFENKSDKIDFITNSIFFDMKHYSIDVVKLLLGEKEAEFHYIQESLLVIFDDETIKKMEMFLKEKSSLFPKEKNYMEILRTMKYILKDLDNAKKYLLKKDITDILYEQIWHDYITTLEKLLEMYEFIINLNKEISEISGAVDKSKNYISETLKNS